MTADALELLGLALAFIGGFALMVEWLEKRERRREAHRERFIARVVWPDTPPCPPTRPRTFTPRQRAIYAKPPISSHLLPWR